MPREVDTQVARVELPLCAAAARVEGRAALVLGVREAGPATETQRMLGLWWHVGVDALARPETASQGQRSQSVARLPVVRVYRPGNNSNTHTSFGAWSPCTMMFMVV